MSAVRYCTQCLSYRQSFRDLSRGGSPQIDGSDTVSVVGGVAVSDPVTEVIVFKFSFGMFY